MEAQRVALQQQIEEKKRLKEAEDRKRKEEDDKMAQRMMESQRPAQGNRMIHENTTVDKPQASANPITIVETSSNPRHTPQVVGFSIDLKKTCLRI